MIKFVSDLRQVSVFFLTATVLLYCKLWGQTHTETQLLSHWNQYVCHYNTIRITNKINNRVLIKVIVKSISLKKNNLKQIEF